MGWLVDPGSVVYGSVHSADGVCVSNAEGGLARLRDWVNTPCRGGVNAEGETFSCLLRVYHEKDTRWVKDIAAFLVEFTRSVGGGYGDDYPRAAFVGEKGCGVLELGSDAVAPVLRLYSESLDYGYRIGQSLNVVSVSFQDSWVTAVLYAVRDEYGTDKLFLVPCPDQFTGEYVTGLDRELWERNVAWFTDLFGEQAARGFIVVAVADKADTDGVVQVPCQVSECHGSVSHGSGVA